MQHATGLSQSHIVEWRLSLFFGGGGGVKYFQWLYLVLLVLFSYFPEGVEILGYISIVVTRNFYSIMISSLHLNEWFFINVLLLNFFLKNDLFVKFLWFFKLMTFRLLSCNIANKLDFTFHAVQYNYNKYSLLLYTTYLPHLCPHQIILLNFWYHIEREFHWLSYIFCSLII